MALRTSTLGICQSDVLIRGALIEGIKKLQAEENEWLLDYVFVGLPQDSLTSDHYGQKESDEAKKWFRSTQIAVVLNVNIQEPKLPCITIGLDESSEDKNTLADIHYDTAEDSFRQWPTIATITKPISYDVSTGYLVIDPDIVVDTPIFAGQAIVTKRGAQYPIQEMIDYHTLRLNTGIVADFTGAQIKSASPSCVMQLESAIFKESFTIGCHAPNKPVYALYLHSVIMFILLRYRQTLLEARGFECSVLSSRSLMPTDAFGEEQPVYSRYITISGQIRQYWPKWELRKVEGIETQMLVSTSEENQEYPEIDNWSEFEDEDILGE